MQTNQVKSINGYGLFHDIEDKELQCRNRAVVMANIMEDNLYPDGTPTQGGIYYVMKYWEAVEGKDKAAVYDMFKNEMLKRKMLEDTV